MSDNMKECRCVKSSDEKDFENKVTKLLNDGFKIATARYECYISNFVWYAILIKEGCE